MRKLIALMIIAAVVLGVVWAAEIAFAGPPKPRVYIQTMDPLPFGPGWAADYGTTW